jgi:hypothetical protein
MRCFNGKTRPVWRSLRALTDADDNHADWIVTAIQHVYMIYADERDAAVRICNALLKEPDPHVRQGAARLSSALAAINPVFVPAAADLDGAGSTASSSGRDAARYRTSPWLIARLTDMPMCAHAIMGMISIGSAFVVRTTPPLPVDLAAEFPELRYQRATATRLHPRPGVPTVHDSSIGGPLLWPSDEPWPNCTGPHDEEWTSVQRPATVRRVRAILARVSARRAAGGSSELTPEERAEMPRWDFSEPRELAREPIAFVAVAQVYRRDVSDIGGPATADLLQVLWCPLAHPDLDFCPRVIVRWRRGRDVNAVLAEPPLPIVAVDDHLPDPCVLHPERVTEYPDQDLLPEDLQVRANALRTRTGHSYRGLSNADGWKVRGLPSWALGGPLPTDCATCGSATTLLLTAATGEWDRQEATWRPVEEPDDRWVNPTGVVISRGYNLYVFVCASSHEHPVTTAMSA